MQSTVGFPLIYPLSDSGASTFWLKLWRFEIYSFPSPEKTRSAPSGSYKDDFPSLTHVWSNFRSIKLTILHFALALHVDRETAILHLEVCVLCANGRNSVRLLSNRTCLKWWSILISTVAPVTSSVVWYNLIQQLICFNYVYTYNGGYNCALNLTVWQLRKLQSH